MVSVERGSSPLARGLRTPKMSSEIKRRIIPARAGFTRGKHSSCSRAQDHPRSRGVYADDLVIFASPEGSSPLARGLLTNHAIIIFRGGIIPARAGFTGFPFVLRAARRDHPRSRGVYWAHESDFDSAVGSSPLARGLPHMIWSRMQTTGIIPARAGFTSTPSPSSSTARDHPRSRGVYPICLRAGQIG